MKMHAVATMTSCKTNREADHHHALANNASIRY